MRIDNECVRDILFTIEEVTTPEILFCAKRGYKKNYPKLEKYEEDKVLYHLQYLEMKKFIFMPDSFKKERSYDLTAEGHDFLNSIRNDMD